jgi:hypothetical protein
VAIGVQYYFTWQLQPTVARYQHFAMEDILDDLNLRVEIIKTEDLSLSSHDISVNLLEIMNDTSSFMCHGPTTHTLVMYDSNVIVAGALLHDTRMGIVIIKRICTCAITPPGHALKIIRCLQLAYPTTEIHLSVIEDESYIYKRMGKFRKRSRTNCMCIHNPHMEHLVWNIKPTKIKQSKGANIHLKQS